MAVADTGQLEINFAGSAETGVSDVSLKEVLAVNIHTGAKLYVSADWVDKQKTADRKNGVPRDQKWHRQHRFFCVCCGQGTEYTHVKGAENRHKKHKKVKLPSTHWRLKDGHRHKRGCPDHKKDLQALLGSRIGKDDYVLRPSFIPMSKQAEAFNGLSVLPSSGKISAVGSPLSKGSNDNKFEIFDLRQLEDAIDFLRDELPPENFERLTLQIPRLGKVSVSDSFFDCDEGQDLIDAITGDVIGPAFVGVVPDLSCVNRNENHFEFLCHGMPFEYLGNEFVLRPVVTVSDKAASSDTALSEHMKNGEAIRVMIDPANCSELADRIYRNALKSDPEGVIEFGVSVKTFNNVPNIGRPYNVTSLDRDFYLRPEWFPE